jgi:phosphatidylserine/phosphatidylglycerophosphate/cardiolipin synthase-like enzyme
MVSSPWPLQACRSGSTLRRGSPTPKQLVIDEAVTLPGSYNWTRGAAANSENLNLVSSPAVAAAYAAHWRERLAVSVRYERREDWCRVSRSTMQVPADRNGNV